MRQQKCQDWIRQARSALVPAREGVWAPAKEVWRSGAAVFPGAAGISAGVGDSAEIIPPNRNLLSKEAQKQLLEAELKRIETEKTEIGKRLTTL